MSKSAEQQARDMLQRCGVQDAQSFSAGEVVELANLITEAQEYRHQLAAIKTQRKPMHVMDQIADVLRQKQVAFGREGEVAAAIVATIGLEREVHPNTRALNRAKS